MKLLVGSFLILSTCLVGCGGGGGSTSGYTPGSSTGNPTNSPSAPTVSATVPLALQLYTVYDQTEFAYDLTFQETGTSVCQATTTSPNVTCHLQIPEARLFFSSLNFQFSWMTSNCKLLTFQPYYYRASISATYLPPGSAPGASTIDCSGASSAPGASCWGGAAVQLVPSFPLYTSLIYLPDESNLTNPQSAFLSLKSAFSLHVDDSVNGSGASNRLTANDLNPADVGNTYTSAQMGNIGDGYVANTYVNYTFSCRDDWYDPQTYIINLYITDVNTDNDPPGSGLDNFVTWDEIP